MRRPRSGACPAHFVASHRAMRKID
jgi:hypothetical protein